MAGYYSSGSGFRNKRNYEDTDPMSSIANLSDAMLVFACGLLVALVVAYNVNISNVTQVEIDESQEISEDIENLDVEGAAGNSYTQRGTVYEDPRTGKLYLLEENNGEGDGASGGGSAQNSGEASGQ